MLIPNKNAEVKTNGILEPDYVRYNSQHKFKNDQQEQLFTIVSNGKPEDNKEEEQKSETAANQEEQKSEVIGQPGSATPGYGSNQEPTPHTPANPPYPDDGRGDQSLYSSQASSRSHSDSEEENKDSLESQQRQFDNQLKEQDEKLEKQISEMMEALKQNTFEIQNLYKQIGERE